MINLLKLETYKLKHNKGFLMISVIVIGFCILERILSGAISGEAAFKVGMYDIATVMLLGSIFAGIFIGKDFKDRNINQQIAAGHSRFNILVVKAIVFYVSIEIITLLYTIGAVIVNTINKGWGQPFNMSTVFYILGIVLLRMLLDASCLSVWVFLAFLFRDVTKTMGVSIVLFVAGGGVLCKLAEKFSAFKAIYYYTSHNQARMIVSGALTSDQFISIIVSKIIVIGIFMTLSYIIFRRKDLK